MSDVGAHCVRALCVCVVSVGRTDGEVNCDQNYLNSPRMPSKLNHATWTTPAGRLLQNKHCQSPVATTLHTGFGHSLVDHSVSVIFTEKMLQSEVILSNGDCACLASNLKKNSCFMECSLYLEICDDYY